MNAVQIICSGCGAAEAERGDLCGGCTWDDREEGAEAVQAMWPLKADSLTPDLATARRIWDRLTESQQHTALEEYALYKAGGSFGIGYV